MIDEKIQEIIDLAEIKSSGGVLRYGQAIFNEAHEKFPIEVSILTGSINDCFYQDDLVDPFLFQLREMLECNSAVELLKHFKSYETELKKNLDRITLEQFERYSESTKPVYKLGETMETLRQRGGKV